MSPPRNPVDLLARRVREGGSRPLLTYYRPAAGERTEFSATSFANWVDKTANLLSTLDVERGPVAGPLATTHPGHWVSLIWPLACWQHGVAWAALAEPPSDAELVVIGPDDPRPLLPGATIACSLHPFGLPLGGRPDGVLDYSTEVLAEPDAHWAPPVADTEPAWRDGERRLRRSELLDLPATTGRVLVRPSEPWPTLADAVLRPLLGGGSAVVVAGEVTEAELERIAAAERVSEVLQ